MCKCFHWQSLYGGSTIRKTTEVLLQFEFELLWVQLCWFTLYQWRAEEKTGLCHDVSIHFCHTCRHDVTDTDSLYTKWQHSQPRICGFQISIFTKQTRNQLKNCCESYFLFHSYWQRLLCFFAWGLFLFHSCWQGLWCFFALGWTPLSLSAFWVLKAPFGLSCHSQ